MRKHLKGFETVQSQRNCTNCSTTKLLETHKTSLSANIKTIYSNNLNAISAEFHKTTSERQILVFILLLLGYYFVSGRNRSLYGNLLNGPDTTILTISATAFSMELFTSLKISCEFCCKNVFICVLKASSLNKFEKYGINL